MALVNESATRPHGAKETTVPDKETSSFMRSLCMGHIDEDLILPFPEMSALSLIHI